jgi:hypothetical protein
MCEINYGMFMLQCNARVVHGTYHSAGLTGWKPPEAWPAH